jgi:3-oxoacyl-[acyl-carrier protein] reductase
VMKSVVITGAGSGIGRACALRLAADGYRVTVNDLRAEAGEAVAAEIKAKAGTAIAAAGDVSSEADVETIVDASRAAFGDPTHLVNNAGIVQQALFVDLRPADFDRMFAVHVRGVFLMTKAVLPAMLANKSGVVVNMASQLGQIGGVELTHYSAARSAHLASASTLSRLGRSTHRSCGRCPKNGERQKPRNYRSDGLASPRRSPPRSHFFARTKPACSSARPLGRIPET